VIYYLVGAYKGLGKGFIGAKIKKEAIPTFHFG